MKHGRPILGLVWLAVTGCGQAEVTIAPNGVVHSNHAFIHEHWQEPKLQQLREREDYAQLDRGDEVELLLELCSWTHRQWSHSEPAPWLLDNALSILDAIRAGKTGGWCGQYAYTLVDVAKSLGFFCARYVELVASNRNTHFVAEIWSNQLAKWVMLDADYNAFFRRVSDGVPASALEIRDSLFGGPAVEPVVIDGAALPGDSDPQAAAQKYADLFAHVAVSLRSDLLRHPTAVSAAQRQLGFLFFRDEHTGPPFEQWNAFSTVTRRRADLDHSCNSLQIDHRQENGILELSVSTEGSTPNFSHLEWSPDVAASPAARHWITVEAPVYLRRDKGDRAFLLAPVNKLGRRGVASAVRVRW